MKFDGVVKTQLRDQRAEPDERGYRCWRSAELVGDGWFVVEHCFLSSNGRVIRQWVAPTVAECRRLIRAEGAQWSRVLAYLRAPLSVGTGFIFAEVTDIHEVAASGCYLLRFADGMTVMTPCADGASLSDGLGAERLRPVFSKRGGAID